MCFFFCVSQFAGELRVGGACRRPREPSIERGVQDLLQVPGGDEVQVGSDVGWELLEVLLVAFGQDDALHPGPVGRQDLVFDPTHLRSTHTPDGGGGC